MDLKQPFSLPDIRKYPKEVLIAFLIGLSIYFITRTDLRDAEITRLNARIDTIRTERVRMYDQIFFQKDLIKLKTDTIKATDSLLRKATQQQVEKILQRNGN